MFKRSRLFGLLALVAVGLLAGCGSDDSSGGGGGSSNAESEDPAALLKKAFANPVDSGELKMEGKAEIEGSSRVSGPVSFSVEGPFKMRGRTTLPLVDWDIEVNGGGQDLSGGVVATEDNAFVKFRGQTYEVGKQLYQQFLRQQEQQSKKGPQSIKELGIDPANWLEGAKVADGESIGGSSTRKVTGKIDVEQMVDDVVDVLKNPEVREQFEGTGQDAPEISDSDKQEAVEAVKNADIAVNVDDEDIVRKVVFSAKLDPPDGGDNGVTGGTVELSYELPKVGGAVDITAPPDAKPLALLLQQLGLGSSLPGGGLRTQ